MGCGTEINRASTEWREREREKGAELREGQRRVQRKRINGSETGNGEREITGIGMMKGREREGES